MAIIFVQRRLNRFEKLRVWRLLKRLNALTATATWDPPSVLHAGVSAGTTVTVTGAAVGDAAYAEFDKGMLEGVRINATVTSTDTVTVKLVNSSGTTVDLPSGTVTVRVEK